MNRFIIRQRLSEHARTLKFCEKQPQLHTNFISYAKVLRFEKPTGFAGRRFRAFQRPKIIPPLSCFKIDGLKFASKPTQKSRDFIQNRIINQLQKCKRKLPFFYFRLLDYLSSALTVGYTKFNNTACDFQIVSTLLSRKNINLYAS